MVRTFQISIVAVSIVFAISSPTYGQCEFEWKPSPGYPGTDLYAYSTTTWDPDGPGPEPELLVIGGEFTLAGDINVNSIVAWDGSAWRQLGSGLEARVSALTVFNGQLIAGGSFIDSGGVAVNHIAQFDGSSWQPLSTGMDGSVYSLAVYGGELFAGGEFKSAGGMPAENIARWNGTTWQSVGGGVDNPVLSFTLHEGDLIVGGVFGHAGSVLASNIARWNGSTWQPVGLGTNGGVYALASYNGLLIAAGQFSRAGGVTATNIARWNGVNWQGIGGVHEGSLGGANAAALIVYNGQLIVGGNFLKAAGSTVNGIASWNGTTWQALDSGVSGGFELVFALGMFKGELVVAGDFNNRGGNVARWDGTSWHSLGTGITSHWVIPPQINALMVKGDELIAAGGFYAVGGSTGYRIARWNGVEWNGFGGGYPNGLVWALCQYNDDLVIGGEFFSVGNVTARKVARWDGSNWNQIGVWTNSYVYAVGVYNGDLIAAGDFESAGGVPAIRIARWDGTTWYPFGSGLNNHGRAVTVYNGDLIVGGYFNNAGGVPANYVARWNGAAWQPLGQGLPGGVTCLLVFQGQLYASGHFNDIARWNGENWQLLGSGMNASIYAMTEYYGELVAGGDFTVAGGLACNKVARWDGENWTALGAGLTDGFDVGIDYPTVQALSVFNGELVVGGNFTFAGEHISPFFARWGPVGPSPVIEQHPASPLVCEGSMVSLHASASGEGELSYHWRKSGVSLTDSGELLGTNTNTLTIMHTQVSDTGSYECIATLNDCTQTQSNAATLTVFPSGSADGNLDGNVDGRDIQVFIDELIGFSPVSAVRCAYELSDDGIVSEADIEPFVTRLLGD